jgi:hypothetical protein
MEKKKIIFVIILCIAVILAVGCKSGVGNITGSAVTSGKIMDNETKEDTTSKEIATEQNKEAGGKITTSAIITNKIKN